MLSKNGITVLEKRYLEKDAQGNLIELPIEMMRRVARTLAAVELQHGQTPEQTALVEEAFFQLLWDGDFLPNSPTLANAGTRTGQLSACFVLPVPDDLAGIFETIKNAALIHQTGGGTGFAFSRLRPAKDMVQSTKGESSGPISFMDVFNAATESIKQGGMRRGANMGILRVNHPDILSFISHKEDLSKLTNFNISVAITDRFMDAVVHDNNYDLINPRTGQDTDRIRARPVFKEIVKRAWTTGEPGIVFIDRMNEYCPVPWLGKYEATNPCGEQPLIPYESCNLGSINLEQFVMDMPQGGPDCTFFDWERLRGVVHTSAHMLDNVISANKYPIPEIAEVSNATRKTGLGVMGFARALFKLQIPYGSPEGLAFAEEVMSFIDYESKVKSLELGKARGVFPARIGHEAESNAIFRKMLMERHARPGKHKDCRYDWLADEVDIHGLRNSNTTTCAPTGTLSMIADTSGGCEPVFALAFKRFQADTHMFDADRVFADALRAKGFDDARIAYVFEALDTHYHGSLNELVADNPFDRALFFTTGEMKILFNLARIFVTTHDISPAQHVHTQAAFQRFNDSAISKTINFPESATEADVEEAYHLAYETGCKGITVYRNNSREAQPLSLTQVTAPAAIAPPPQLAELQARLDSLMAEMRAGKRIRPEVLTGFTMTKQVGEGKLYTTLNYDEEGLREVVTNIGRSGGTLNSFGEAIGKLISLALQHRVPVEDISHALVGIRGADPSGFGDNQVLSVPDAIGKAIRRAPLTWSGGPIDLAPREAVTFALGLALPLPLPPAPNAQHAANLHALDQGETPECPDCGSRLDHGEGCAKCINPTCGYSRCK